MSDTQLASLGAAEAEILKIVWELKSATVQEVWGNLPLERNISPATVQTVLRRLREKGYVGYEVKGKAHHFYPLVKKEKVISKTVKDVLRNFFDGNAAPLLMHIVSREKIKNADLVKLKEIIDKKSSSND